MNQGEDSFGFDKAVKDKASFQQSMTKPHLNRIPILLIAGAACIFVLYLGSTLLFHASKGMLTKWKYERDGVRAVGTITAISPHERKGDLSDAIAYSYTDFTGKNEGRTIFTSPNVTSTVHMGDQVPITYLKNNPSISRPETLSNFDSNIPILFIIGGSLFLLSLAGLLRVAWVILGYQQIRLYGVKTTGIVRERKWMATSSNYSSNFKVKYQFADESGQTRFGEVILRGALSEQYKENSEIPVSYRKNNPDDNVANVW